MKTPFQRSRKRKQLLVDRKGGKCARCNGVFPPEVYDFHHTNPKEKEGVISNMSEKQLSFELPKVILLCANCHRIIHASIGQMGNGNTKKNGPG